ncbi:hypothetical protein M5689_024570 [Euphorbia peplus]|nr:hypothetical protein M5689_024570 [Euphorbia peplus]
MKRSRVEMLKAKDQLGSGKSKGRNHPPLKILGNSSNSRGVLHDVTNVNAHAKLKVVAGSADGESIPFMRS